VSTRWPSTWLRNRRARENGLLAGNAARSRNRVGGEVSHGTDISPDLPMDRMDELDDKGVRSFLELTTITALAAVSTVAALMHGDVFFGMFFGAATGVAAPHLIRRSIDL
jgi:hypothetical protein